MTITLTITGDEQPASIAITSLVSLDTGDDVSGLTLPDAMTDEGAGVWTYEFTEPADGLAYRYEALATWADASTTEIVGTEGLAEGSGDPAPTIAPITIVADGSHYTTRVLPAIAQYSAPVLKFAVDTPSGTAFNLSGKTLRFVVASVTSLGDDDSVFDDTLAGSWKYEAGGGLVIGSGTNANQVTIQHDATNNVTAGEFRWWLWDVDQQVPLALGTLPIKPAILNTP